VRGESDGTSTPHALVASGRLVPHKDPVFKQLPRSGLRRHSQRPRGDRRAHSERGVVAEQLVLAQHRKATGRQAELVRGILRVASVSDEATVQTTQWRALRWCSARSRKMTREVRGTLDSSSITPVPSLMSSLPPVPSACSKRSSCTYGSKVGVC
jgi:hypothetical protein